MEILPVAEDGWESQGEVPDAFLPAQPADVADERGAVGQRGGDGEGVEIEEVAVGDEDFVAVGFKVPFGDEAGGVDDNPFTESTGHHSEYSDWDDKPITNRLHSSGDTTGEYYYGPFLQELCRGHRDDEGFPAHEEYPGINMARFHDTSGYFHLCFDIT